ncbi:MAG TPA: hypothetical protein VFT43_05350, partial [Candidatus Polarisedimenticolia bacterium]|nr:hypothetical protein [Candidatus Polarisedimenticolia bacterium]
RIVAVAMLWRRELYDRLGVFDERFSPANYEDDDYSLRALTSGYRNIVANDVYIHHVGSASHAANGLPQKALQEENRRRLVGKWGADAAPVIAARWADYEAHVALLAPDQFALPGWAVPEVPPRDLARHLARVGRRLVRLGWRTEAQKIFRRSLRTALTVQGLAGLAWSVSPGRHHAPAARPASPRADVV